VVFHTNGGVNIHQLCGILHPSGCRYKGVYIHLITGVELYTCNTKEGGKWGPPLKVEIPTFWRYSVRRILNMRRSRYEQTD